MQTLQSISEILRLVDFPGFTWHVRGTFAVGRAVTLHATFMADDATEPGQRGQQSTRKWLLSRHMVAGEVVQTALKCALTAVEHEARERFTYRGQRVFGPHFDIDQLAALCGHGGTEVRP